MKIQFSPIRGDAADPVLSVDGDTLTVDGAALDLSPLAEGDVLPAEATACAALTGQITRIDGEIIVTVLLPHSADAPAGRCWPEPVTVTEGQVPLPPVEQPADADPQPEEVEE